MKLHRMQTGHPDAYADFLRRQEEQQRRREEEKALQQQGNTKSVSKGGQGICASVAVNTSSTGVGGSDSRPCCEAGIPTYGITAATGKSY